VTSCRINADRPSLLLSLMRHCGGDVVQSFSAVHEQKLLASIDFCKTPQDGYGLHRLKQMVVDAKNRSLSESYQLSDSFQDGESCSSAINSMTA
jgi:hypothetical protein